MLNALMDGEARPSSMASLDRAEASAFGNVERRLQGLPQAAASQAVDLFDKDGLHESLRWGRFLMACYSSVHPRCLDGVQNAKGPPR
jgi:hypothetical protein